MNTLPFRLLLLEDNPGDARLVQQALADQAPGEFTVTTVERLADALMRIQTERFDAALCDLGLPDSVGLATAQAIVARAPALALVVLTGTDDKDIGRAAIELGAQDYLVKGEARAPAIVRTLRYSIERKRLQNELNEANETLERRVAERTAELEAAKTLLSASEARYRGIFAHSRDGIVLIDVQTGLVVDCNAEFERQCGRPLAQLQGLCIWELRSPDAREAARTKFEEVKSKGAGGSGELPLQRPDGTVVPVEFMSARVRLGDRDYLQSTSHDITERKRAEAQLNLQGAALNSAANAIVITDRAGAIVWVNRAFSAASGYAFEDLIGQNPRLFKSGRQSPEFYRQMFDTLTEGAVWQGEIVNRYKDGRLVTEEMTITPIRSEDGQIANFIAIKQDISERKNQELRISRLNRILSVLSGINAAIMRVRNRQELFNEACRIAVEHGNFEVAWIGTLDAATQDVTAVAWTGNNAETLTTIKRSARDDTVRGRGAVGRAIRERRLVFNNDIVDQGAHGPSSKEVMALGFRSQLTLPLFEGQTVVGVLTMYAREPGYFDEDERRLLSQLAEDISFALAHIANQEKIAGLSRIQALTSGINAMIVRVRDRQQLFDEACRIAVEQGGFGIAWIGTFNPQNLEVSPVATAGIEADFLLRYNGSANPDLPQGQGSVGRAIREKRAVAVNDLHTAPRAFGERRKEAIRRGYHSNISLPLLMGGAVAGNLTLYTREQDFFTAEEVNLLSGVARNISFALDHLVDQQRLEKLSRIRTLSGEINALIVRVRDRQQLFREACRIAVEHGGFGIAWIGLMDQQTLEIIPAVCVGVEADSLIANGRISARADTPAGLGTVGYAIRKRRPVFSNDLSAEITQGNARRQEALRRGYRSIIALPLVVGDKAVGVLSLLAREPDFFTEEEVGLLSELAGNISFALDLIEKSEALANSEKKLDDILSALHEVVWSMDPHSGRILYVNAAVEYLTRLPAGDFLGQRRLWRRLVHRDDRASVNDSIRRLLQTDVLVHQFRIVLANGDIRTLESSARVQRNEQGTAERIDGTISDVTERKHAEQERALLASIVEYSNDAIITRDLERKITSWNAAAEHLFGWRAAKVIGHDVSIIIPPDRISEGVHNRELLNRGLPVPMYDTERVTKAGRRVEVSVGMSPVRNEQGEVTAISLVFHDISERRRLEREDQSKAALTQLLEVLARTANEAINPDEALRQCLRHICEHGGWTLGRFGRFGAGRVGGRPQVSHWHVVNPACYADFMALSDHSDHTVGTGRFIGKLLREQRPVWIADITRAPVGERIAAAARSGLRAAFAFPVVVGGVVCAYLEFFADELREPDPLMLAACTSIAAQLARLIERDEADTVIRASEAQMRAILDNEPECVCVVDADGSLIDINRAGLAMLEAGSIEQLRAHGLLEIVIPEHRARYSEHLNRVRAGKRAMLEFEIVALKGAHRWLESHAAPMAQPDNGGNVVLSVTRDVTERVQAAEFQRQQYAWAQLHAALVTAANEARTAEQAFQSSLKLLSDYGGWRVGHIVIFAPGTVNRYTNTSSIWQAEDHERFAEFIKFCEQFDYTKSRLLAGKAIADKAPVWIEDLAVIGPGSRGRLAVAAGLHCAFAFPVVVQDEVSAVLEFYADEARAADPMLMDNVLHIGAQLARVIERTQASEGRTRLAAIVSSSQDGIVSSTADGTILTWNAGAEKMFGYTSQEIVGQNAVVLTPHDLRRERQQHRQHYLSGDSFEPYESERLTKDQRRLAVSVNTSPLRDESNRMTGIATIYRDITERKQAEAVLYDSRSRLQELSQRLIETEDDVRRRINSELHDRVGANLAALALNVSIVRTQLPPQSLRAVGPRLDGTQRLIEDTTRQVRDLMAELHPPALDDYGLHAALRTYVNSLGVQFKVRIILSGEPYTLRLPRMVETALYRVAQGALVNAATHARAKRIEVMLAESPDRLTLTIADDGVGFDVARASVARASWGLAIMRERAQTIGAELILESTPGKGTRVRVEMPREMCQRPDESKS